MGSDLLLSSFWVISGELFYGGEGEIKSFEVVLGEHGNSETLISVLVSLMEFEFCNKQFQEGGFSDSVCSDDAESGFAIDAEIDISEDDIILGVTEGSVLDLEEGWSEFFWGREDENAGGVFDDLVDQFQLIDSLDSALDHGGSFGVVPEFIDEGLHVRDGVVLGLELLTLELEFFGTGFFEGVVVTLIVGKLLVVEMDDLLATNIQEFSGVRNYHDSLFTINNIILEPHDCIQVEMVCRLIEQ